MRFLDTYSGLTTTEPSGRRSALRVGDSVASSAPPVRKRVWFSSALSAMGLSDTDRREPILSVDGSSHPEGPMSEAEVKPCSPQGG
ncbi:hypothetical protein MRX96_031462 [Rhipicephalus microplus]